MSARALERLEMLLTGIYDLDVGCRVEDFLVTDRQSLPGECHDAPGDEQLFVSAVDDELCMSLYLDPALIERLDANDPSAVQQSATFSPFRSSLGSLASSRSSSAGSR